MALMKVEDALTLLMEGVGETQTEHVSLREALGRVLSSDLMASRNQPPFDASAMDGYAVKADNIRDLPTKLQIVGEVPAGQSFSDRLGNWEAVRIFTGAPVPEGADAILIQEHTERDGAFVTALEPVAKGRFIRPAGLDFKQGDVLLRKGQILDPGHIALAASMNHAAIPVYRRPRVALLSTGDELVLPGDVPAADQIISSNNFGVAGLAEQAGAEVLDLGIARDDADEIAATIAKAQAAEVDILVTSGGVSVGDHDLAREVLTAAGMSLDFWRIAMRPGKPLMAGQLGNSRVLGLPGNPVSAMICSILFLQPLIRKMLGQSAPLPSEPARLGAALGANDERQSYLRGTLGVDEHGRLIATPFSGQDSAMLAGFARANCLIIHPPHCPEQVAGDPCQIIRL